MSLLDKLDKFKKSQEEIPPEVKKPEKILEKISPEVVDKLIENAEIINVPNRVMMSIIVQLKMFDKTTIGLTPKGNTKKEFKAEIKHLVSKLSEK